MYFPKDILYYLEPFLEDDSIVNMSLTCKSYLHLLYWRCSKYLGWKTGKMLEYNGLIQVTYNNYMLLQIVKCYAIFHARDDDDDDKKHLNVFLINKPIKKVNYEQYIEIMFRKTFDNIIGNTDGITLYGIFQNEPVFLKIYMSINNHNVKMFKKYFKREYFMDYTKRSFYNRERTLIWVLRRLQNNPCILKCLIKMWPDHTLEEILCYFNDNLDVQDVWVQNKEVCRILWPFFNETILHDFFMIEGGPRKIEQLIDEEIIDPEETWEKFIEYQPSLFFGYDNEIEELLEFLEEGEFDTNIECVKQLLHSKYYKEKTKQMLRSRLKKLRKHQLNMGTYEYQPYIDSIYNLLQNNDWFYVFFN